MPWVTPTLEQVRSLNRDNIQSQLRSGPMVPNSVLRVMADSNAGLAYLTLLYLNWLALQIMPDTSETEFLDRYGSIYQPGGSSRKTATFATLTATITGITGMVLSNGSVFNATLAAAGVVLFQTTSNVTIGAGATSVNLVALTSGQTGLQVGNSITQSATVSGIDANATITVINDGIPEETDDELRVRVLDRIRQPPMGGDASDNEQWALAVSGVTRAFCSPNEMGVGTVTVRFMMDDLRTTTDPLTNGFPNGGDVANVLAYLQTKRPVAIKDFFVEAPIPQPINFTIQSLVTDNTFGGTAAIVTSVTAMLFLKAKPGYAINGVTQTAQEIFAVWVSDAILNTQGVISFDLVMSDQTMANNGCMAVLGTITYA